MADQRGSTVQSVERAIAILKSFGPGRPERGVNELSREMGLHKSTVSRLMMTLERGGLLARNPDSDRYRLGIDLIGLGSQAADHMDVRQVARPLLKELSEQCQETVNLVFMDAGQVVNVDQYSPPLRQVRNIGAVGRRMPPHCTAAGKVLLAYVSSKARRELLPNRLECFTLRTVSELDRFERELELVTRQGYATVEEELEEGLNALAAPVFDHTGEVCAAASVAGPAYRVTAELFPSLAHSLVTTAAEISRQLGFVPFIDGK